MSTVTDGAGMDTRESKEVAVSASASCGSSMESSTMLSVTHCTRTVSEKETKEGLGAGLKSETEAGGKPEERKILNHVNTIH